LKSATATEYGKGAGRVIDVRLKSPVAIANQDRDVVGISIRDRQVEFAVLIEVARNNLVWIRPRYGIRNRRLECAIALAQQDADAITSGIRGHQVEIAVHVEIGADHPGRIEVHRIIDIG
jgi:hypothetical protein